MVRCMFADNELPIFLWGELIFTAAILDNVAPYSAIGARASVQIKTHTKKAGLNAVEGCLVRYSNNIKSYRVYNQATRGTMENRSVIF